MGEPISNSDIDGRRRKGLLPVAGDAAEGRAEAVLARNPIRRSSVEGPALCAITNDTKAGI